VSDGTQTDSIAFFDRAHYRARAVRQPPTSSLFGRDGKDQRAQTCAGSWQGGVG